MQEKEIERLQGLLEQELNKEIGESYEIKLITFYGGSAYFAIVRLTCPVGIVQFYNFNMFGKEWVYHNFMPIGGLTTVSLIQRFEDVAEQMNKKGEEENERN